MPRIVLHDASPDAASTPRAQPTAVPRARPLLEVREATEVLQFVADAGEDVRDERDAQVAGSESSSCTTREVRMR
jgi:hypothetical protein